MWTDENDPAAGLRSRLHEQRFIGIVRESGPEEARLVAERLLAAGVRLVEVSLTTPGALDVVADLATLTRDRGEVAIGAGTVLDVASAREAARRGASFVLSPVFDPDVVAAVRDAGLAAVPGCATPSEMLTAARAGAAAVKIFPASLWTPGSLKDVLAALPHLACVPTGGISMAQAPAWIGAGALAVGLGSTLARADDAELARFASVLAQV
jgi:2-dehydro-3-deoxyphosphogluconate aldolase / (4S)-4-hydroxy-2-oxoglutarate aldolase